MFNKTLTNILTIPREAFAGQIINDRLNPFHLALASNGYRVQSRTLRIPDRYGFFSPGPPRLQVYEAVDFITMICCIAIILVFNALMVFASRLDRLPPPKPLGSAALFLGMNLFVVIIFWIVAIHDRHRAPGYEWTDWKMRKD